MRFTLIISHKSSFLPEQQADSDRQQQQLEYLAEVTKNYIYTKYISKSRDATFDALFRLPAGEEEAEGVCAVMTADSLRHWNRQELLAAQLEDHQTLAADKGRERGWSSCPAKVDSLNQPA